MKRIPLAKNKYALVDDEDFAFLNQWEWRINNGYAERTGSTVKHLYMHRVVMNPPAGMQVDHINRNKLDNRKVNLRHATPQANCRNSSKAVGKSSVYKGVSYDKVTDQWRAYFFMNNKQKWIGRFDTELHAAVAYDMWTTHHYEGFEKTNFSVVQQ